MNQIKYMLIVSLLITAFSCESQQPVFKKAEYKNGDLDLYIIPYSSMIHHDLDLSGLIINNGYKIEESVVVKEILENWYGTDNVIASPYAPYYYIEVGRDGRTFTSRWISDDFTVVVGEKLQSVDKNSLLKYRTHFKPLIAADLVISNLSDARRSIEILQENSGYLPYHTPHMLYMWEEYSGSIELRCLNSELPNFNDSNPVDDYLNKEFSKISKVFCHSFNIEISQDTAMFEIYTEHDITESIPDGYFIGKEWEELTDLEFQVYNLTTNDIANIFDENSIDYKSIKRSNFINTDFIRGAWGNDDLGNAEFVLQDDSIYYPDPNLWFRYEINRDTIQSIDDKGDIELIQILRLENDTLVLKYIDFDVAGTYKRRR